MRCLRRQFLELFILLVEPTRGPADRSEGWLDLPLPLPLTVDAAAKAAGLGESFTGHSGRVGMAQNLAATGVELPA